MIGHHGAVGEQLLKRAALNTKGLGALRGKEGVKSHHFQIKSLKVLCYKAEVEGDQSCIEAIETYGTELFDMAKAETIDLEELGEQDETLLDLLKIIRSYGAR